MQQQNSNVLMYEEKQRFNMSKREEIVPRYILASLLTIDEENMRMKSLKKELKILNLKFIMWLNNNSQLKAFECPEELNQYL